MEIILVKKNTIVAELQVDDKSVTIKGARVLFLGATFKVLEVVDKRVEFEITEMFESGNYEIVFDVEINGKANTAITSFVVTNDGIDPSLPIDLQNLKNEIQSV